VKALRPRGGDAAAPEATSRNETADCDAAAPESAGGEQAAHGAGGREAPGVLGRYVLAASAARTADEGMAPALALLVAAAGREPALAGVLLAAAGLPHVVAGPLTGAALDASSRRRTVLALAPLVFGLVLVASAVGVGRLPDLALVALVACAGCAGPLLAGGLSAELTTLVPARAPRAPALDGASYNAAAIAGPAVVAGCAALAGAEVAALALGALALAAAALVMRLPSAPASDRRQGRGLDGARRLWRSPPLRRVTAGTTLAFVGAGALPLLVIARADELGSAAAGAALLAAMATGALAGALLTPAGHAERRVVIALLAVALALAAAAASPGLPLLAVALVAAGLADGVLLPAVLAVRAEHSRPEERGAVFTTAASMKIAAGAGGAAIGGALAGATGAATALVAAAALHAAGALLLCLSYRSAS
jgi:MFS family permease